MTPADKDVMDRLRGLLNARFGGPSAASSEHLAFCTFASAPGRVELAGNHTDHQGGRTIAAAIEKRAYTLATPNGTDEIRVLMEGFGEATVSTLDLDARPEEAGTSIALVRGMAAAFERAGGTLRGFDMATASDIPVGSGLSSSAAFELAVASAIRSLCDPLGENAPSDPTTLALEAVWAERVYFGKPCGAQDQLASAYGGVVALDFGEETPRVEPLEFDADACGYALCLIDSRCDHSAYTDEYAAVPADMFAAAGLFDQPRLEDVPYQAFLNRLPAVRAELGDRAVLRALHYFEETRRVSAQRRALADNDFERFLELVRQSGSSSAQYLQNVSPRADGTGSDQPAMIILALCTHLLEGNSDKRASGPRGAYRIHGGGFGGSVLAFVPDEDASAFRESMDSLLGYEACMPVAIGARGAFAERVDR